MQQHDGSLTPEPLLRYGNDVDFLKVDIGHGMLVIKKAAS